MIPGGAAAMQPRFFLKRIIKMEYMQKLMFRGRLRKASRVILALCCGASLCAIISEPSEGFAVGRWLLWESASMAALVICAKCLEALLTDDDKS